MMWEAFGVAQEAFGTGSELVDVPLERGEEGPARAPKFPAGSRMLRVWQPPG